MKVNIRFTDGSAMEGEMDFIPEKQSAFLVIRDKMENRMIIPFHNVKWIVIPEKVSLKQK